MRVQYVSGGDVDMIAGQKPGGTEDGTGNTAYNVLGNYGGNNVDQGNGGDYARYGNPGGSFTLEKNSNAGAVDGHDFATDGEYIYIKECVTPSWPYSSTGNRYINSMYFSMGGSNCKVNIASGDYISLEIRGFNQNTSNNNWSSVWGDSPDFCLAISMTAPNIPASNAKRLADLDRQATGGQTWGGGRIYMIYNVPNSWATDGQWHEVKSAVSYTHLTLPTILLV